MVSSVEHQQEKEREAILGFMEDLNKSMSSSEELLNEFGILDSMSKVIARLVNSPIDALEEFYMSTDSLMSHVIKTLVAAGVYRNENTVDLFVQHEGKVNLHFYILTETDSVESRGDYYDFLDKVESEVDFIKKFKIHFHFITEPYRHKLNETITEHLDSPVNK